MEDQKKQSSNSGGGNKPSMNFYWIYGVIGVMLLAMLMLNTSEGGREIQWMEFKQKIEDGQVKRLVFDAVSYTHLTLPTILLV